MKQAKIILLAIIVLGIVAADSEAKLFGRRAARRGGGGTGTETFPPGTPAAPNPGQGAVANQVCTPQGCPPALVAPQMAPPVQIITQVAPQPIIAEVVLEDPLLLSMQQISAAEGQISELRNSLNDTMRKLEAAKREQKRAARKRVIQIESQLQLVEFDHDNAVEDLKTQIVNLNNIFQVPPPAPTE